MKYEIRPTINTLDEDALHTETGPLPLGVERCEPDEAEQWSVYSTDFAEIAEALGNTEAAWVADFANEHDAKQYTATMALLESLARMTRPRANTTDPTEDSIETLSELILAAKAILGQPAEFPPECNNCEGELDADGNCTVCDEPAPCPICERTEGHDDECANHPRFLAGQPFAACTAAVERTGIRYANLGPAFAFAVECSDCGTQGPDGPTKGTENAAKTAACDAAKVDGWKIDGNDRALCADCDNAESNREGEI